MPGKAYVQEAHPGYQTLNTQALQFPGRMLAFPCRRKDICRSTLFFTHVSAICNFQDADNASMLTLPLSAHDHPTEYVQGRATCLQKRRSKMAFQNFRRRTYKHCNCKEQARIPQRNTYTAEPHAWKSVGQEVLPGPWTLKTQTLQYPTRITAFSLRSKDFRSTQCQRTLSFTYVSLAVSIVLTSICFL